MLTSWGDSLGLLADQIPPAPPPPPPQRQQTDRTAGRWGKQEPPGRAPSLHLHWEGRAPPKGPRKESQLPEPLPSEGMQLPGSKALHRLWAGRGRMLGFSRDDISSTRITRSTRLSASPGLLAVPQPSVDLETSLHDGLISMLELYQDLQGQGSKIDQETKEPALKQCTPALHRTQNLRVERTLKYHFWGASPCSLQGS